MVAMPDKSTPHDIAPISNDKETGVREGDLVGGRRQGGRRVGASNGISCKAGCNMEWRSLGNVAVDVHCTQLITCRGL